MGAGQDNMEQIVQWKRTQEGPEGAHDGDGTTYGEAWVA